MSRIDLYRRMHARLRLLLALALLAACTLLVARPSQAQTSGPGLPKLTFAAADLFKPISTIRTTNASGQGRGNGLATMHKGYLAVPYGRDSGASGGGFAFYDVSNPRSPALVSRFDRTELREAHGFARSNSYPGSYIVLQAGTGIEFWDWTDVRNPVLLNHLNLPGVNFSDYDVGAWWLAWQAPFVYVGASGNGIYIVDATDPRNPSVVKNIPISQTGGFRIHPVFPVGNLLVATSADFSGTSTGIVTLDISDPRNPVVLRAQSTGLPILYSSFFSGNKLIGLGNFDHTVYVWDLSNPTVFPLVGQIGGLDRPVYATVQDGVALIGDESSFVKIDIRSTPFQIVGDGTSGLSDRSEDIITPLGNLALVANDHGTGSAIIPHQAAPDNTGPSVTMVNPPNNATGQKLTSRVGVTLSDWFELDSVTSSSFVVRPLGGAALPGKYSGEQGILNFWPDQPLLPGTTYEVVLPAGGVKDFSGNPIATTFTSRFTTAGSGNSPTVVVAPKPPAQVGQAVGFSISGSGGATPLTFSWDFGDGSPPTAFSSSSTASHSYAAAGHYAVKVTVRNSAGESSSSYTQTIHHPATSGRPSTSSTIVIDGARNRIWAVNSDTNSVTAINGADNTRLFERVVGRDPRTLAQAPDGTIWVVNLDDATVSVLDRDTGNTLQTIALPPGSQPYGLAFSPNGSAAYVSTQGSGQLIRLNPTTRAVAGSLTLGGPLRGIAVTHDSARVLVTRFISPADRGEVVEVSAASFAVARTIALAHDPGPDGNINGRGVPNYLSAITISPDGRQARVPSKKDNTSRGTYRDGQPLNFESTVRTIVSKIDLAANAEVLADRVDLNDRDMADAVVFSPLGDYIFVATQGTNTVEVFDAYNNRLMTGINNVGRAPQGLALSADGTRLYVQNFLSRTVAVYDVGGIVSSTSNSFQHLATVATITIETLPAQVLQGKQIFYNADDRRMNRDGYIACASCHLDGDSDGRVWDFTDRGEGLRNTVALQGRGGLLHGNVHWTANFDEIQDFEHDIRGPFGGLGFLSDAAFNSGNRNTPLGGAKAGISADLDALAAYVSSLSTVGRSPFRDASGGLTADGQAGRLIFNQLQCYSCHAGAEFTDSRSGLSHNVGTIKASSGKASGQTLTGLDTPSLKGVWQTAPYLHDGSAATLLDVLTTANASNQHGNLSALTGQQRSQLVAYLQQIDDTEKASPPSLLFVGALGGGQQVPPVATAARGQARAVLGPDGLTALVSLRLSGLSSTQTSARIHGPAAAGATAPALFTLPNGAFSNHSVALTAQQVQQLKDGLLYISVQSSSFPNGEIRAQLKDASVPPPVPPTERNLAQGRPATSSTAESNNPVASGNDGDPATRWSANTGGAGQWWQVDLGAAYSLTGSEVMWEFAGRQYRYRVEASSNGSTWTTVADKTASTSTAQTQRDDFSATARYVRITVTGLPTSPTTWASFFEFRVFGVTPTSATNLAQGKTVSASSAEAANPAASGNDGSGTSRWCAANGNTGNWWQVDLGASYNLTGSEVMWEFAGRQYRYRVEVSSNGSTWTTVADKTASTSTAQTQRDDFSATARYVRITVTGLPTSPSTWASFYEFRVFGTP